MELLGSVNAVGPRQTGGVHGVHGVGGVGSAGAAGPMTVHPVVHPVRPVGRAQHHQPTAADQHIGPREMTRQVENGHAIWRIGCGDMINRDRCLTVFVDQGEVVVISPPGESARLSASQVGQLRAALNEAAKFAER